MTKTYRVSKTIRITYTRTIEARSAHEAEEIAEAMGEPHANDSVSETAWKAHIAPSEPRKVREIIRFNDI